MGNKDQYSIENIFLDFSISYIWNIALRFLDDFFKANLILGNKNHQNEMFTFFIWLSNLTVLIVNFFLQEPSQGQLGNDFSALMCFQQKVGVM